MLTTKTEDKSKYRFEHAVLPSWSYSGYQIKGGKAAYLLTQPEWVFEQHMANENHPLNRNARGPIVSTTRMFIDRLVYRRWTRDSEWLAYLKGRSALSIKAKSVDSSRTAPQYNPPIFRRKYPEGLFSPPYKLVTRQRKESETLSSYNAYLVKVEWNYDRHMESLKKAFERKLNRRRLVWAEHQKLYLQKLARYDRKFAEKKQKFDDWYTLHNAGLPPKGVVRKALRAVPPIHPYLKVELEAIADASAPVTYATVVHDGFRALSTSDVPNGRVWKIRYDTLLDLGPPDDLAGAVASGLVYNAREHLKETLDGHLDNLVRKTYSKLNDGDVHIGNMLAERHQTYDLIRTNFHRLLKLVQSPKRAASKVIGTLKSPKAIADEVLAFQFGAKPLMEDIANSAQLIQDMAWGTPDDNAATFLRVGCNIRGRAGLEIDYTGNGFSFKGKLHYSMVTYWELENGFLRSLQQFGLNNPDEIAWEVTPWSFVVDWALPIGQFLSAKNTLSSVLYHSGCSKLRLVGEFSFWEPAPAIDGSSMFFRTGPAIPSGTFVGEMLIREPAPIAPDPLRILHIKDPVSLNHGIDAIALAIQKAGQKFRRVPKKRR